MQHRCDYKIVLIPTVQYWFRSSQHVCRAFEIPIPQPGPEPVASCYISTPNFQAEKIQCGLADRDKPVRSSLSLCLSESFPSLMSLDKYLQGYLSDELTKRDWFLDRLMNLRWESEVDTGPVRLCDFWTRYENIWPTDTYLSGTLASDHSRSDLDSNSWKVL